MLNTQVTESITGLKGQTTGDVFKLSAPREDVRVTLDGFEINPLVGLTSWVAFRHGPHHVTLMGDIVGSKKKSAARYLRRLKRDSS